MMESGEPLPGMTQSVCDPSVAIVEQKEQKMKNHRQWL